MLDGGTNQNQVLMPFITSQRVDVENCMLQHTASLEWMEPSQNTLQQHNLTGDVALIKSCTVDIKEENLLTNIYLKA